jgi:7-carboxy-7-deazaguanine synthase
MTKELAAIFNDPSFIRLSGDGVFATLQGEGVSAGRPSIFVRTQDCNLHCGNEGQGWRCDADYTWDKKIPEYAAGLRLAPASAIAEEVALSWDTHFGAYVDSLNWEPNIVFTGGEPLLQQKKLAKVASLLTGWHVEIETNGTIPVDEAFHEAQINCSPKLASSGNTLRARRRLDALRSIAQLPHHWFKFVIADEADITEVTTLMQSVNGGNFGRVLLMAQGVSVDTLQQNSQSLSAIAQKLGCEVTERNHIYWFGNTRRT